MSRFFMYGTAFNGVTVEVYSENGILLDSSISYNNTEGDPGYYLFTGLEEGIYQVKFIPLDGYSLTQEEDSLENGSKPNSITGSIILARNQHILDIDAIVKLETALQIKLETFECNKCDSDCREEFN